VRGKFPAMRKPDPKTMTLAQLVKALRDEREWSQTDVETATGIPQETVSSWERGALTEAIDRLRTLAKTFGMSLGRMLGDEAAPPPVRPGDYLVDMTVYRKIITNRISEIPEGEILRQKIPPEFVIVSKADYDRLATKLPRHLR
jgi:transcriptional regulator with XRE-family HTH domain